MNRRMPHSEDVSREHNDATVMAHLKAERDLPWTEVALVMLHPREEIRRVLSEDAERYQRTHEQRFSELLRRLKSKASLYKEATSNHKTVTTPRTLPSVGILGGGGKDGACVESNRPIRQGS